MIQVLFDNFESLNRKVDERLPVSWGDPALIVVLGVMLSMIAIVLMVYSIGSDQLHATVITLGACLIVAVSVIVVLVCSGTIALCNRRWDTYCWMVADTIRDHGNVLLITDDSCSKQGKLEVIRALENRQLTVIDGEPFSDYERGFTRLVQGVKYVLRLEKEAEQLHAILETRNGKRIAEAKGVGGIGVVDQLLAHVPLNVHTATVE